jgi:hypothetical protein
MLKDVKSISDTISTAKERMACEPIRDYWFELFNQGESQERTRRRRGQHLAFL